MTLKLTLIGITAVAAMALTASTALAGEPTMRGLSDFPQAQDSGAAAQAEPQKRGLSDFGLPFGHISDASDRAQQATVYSYPDAIQRAVAQPVQSTPLSGHTDRYELDLPNGPVAAATSDSGWELQWPELGIGFGVGMVFVLGLILAVRLTRGRPLAHG